MFCVLNIAPAIPIWKIHTYFERTREKVNIAIIPQIFLCILGAPILFWSLVVDMPDVVGK